MKISDNSERNQRDKAAVTKGEDNRGENIKSGFFVFGVERKVIIRILDSNMVISHPFLTYNLPAARPSQD